MAFEDSFGPSSVPDNVLLKYFKQQSLSIDSVKFESALDSLFIGKEDI